MLTRFDEDRRDVLEKLNALAPATSPSLPIAGAALAADTLRPFGSLFSAVVVLSAGAIDEDRSRAEALVEPIVASGTILHVVMNAASRPSAPAAAAAAATNMIRELADQTRGHYTAIYTAASYQAALDRIADRLTTELMVEYLVPAESKPSEVKLGVRVPGARVRGLGVAPR
jgi:hypothetical protein